MSGIKNLFAKKQTFNTQPSHLLVDPVFTNAAQMNNEFLHHHKPLGWQNSQGLWQTSQPLQSFPLQSTFSQQQPYWQSRGLSNRGGPYRQIRLRTQNWGTRSENGWSGFNNSRYQSQNLSSWEPQNFILSELREQNRSQRGLTGPFNQDLFWQQWQQQRFSQQGWGSQQRGLSGLNNGFSGLSLQKTAVPQQFVQTIFKPAIVQETVRTDRVLQVQPILHREVERSVINHIEKHITEAPAAHMGGVVRMAPVVQEVTQTRVIEEIQPVVHREVAIAQVERVEEHLAEHIVAPTQHTNQVLYESASTLAPVAPLAAPINSAPLSNTVNITKVVPTGLAGQSPLLLEKQQQASLAQPLSPTYGAAMM